MHPYIKTGMLFGALGVTLVFAAFFWSRNRKSFAGLLGGRESRRTNGRLVEGSAVQQ